MTPGQMDYWQSLIAQIQCNETRTINVGSAKARAVLLAVNELLADELARRKKEIGDAVKAELMRS